MLVLTNITTILLYVQASKDKKYISKLYRDNIQKYLIK